METQDSSRSGPLITIAELAREHGLPESTARFYCKRFLSFMPYVGQGKRRRYKPEAREVFAAILEQMQRTKNANAVEAALAARFPSVNGTTPESGLVHASQQVAAAPAGFDPKAVSLLLKAQGKALVEIAGAVARLAEKEGEIEDLRARLERSEAKSLSLGQELQVLKRMQDEAEKVHQQDLEQLRKWMSHLAAEQVKSKE